MYACVRFDVCAVVSWIHGSSLPVCVCMYVCVLMCVGVVCVCVLHNILLLCGVVELVCVYMHVDDAISLVRRVRGLYAKCSCAC